MKKDRLFISEKKYEFTNKEFKGSILSTSSTTEWTMIQKFEILKNYYILCLSNRLCHLIPKRAFKNKEEKTKFEMLLEDQIETDKR